LGGGEKEKKKKTTSEKVPKREGGGKENIVGRRISVRGKDRKYLGRMGERLPSPFHTKNFQKGGDDTHAATPERRGGKERESR